MKQLLIAMGFCLLGSFFISIVCTAFINEPYSYYASFVAGGVWGWYIAYRAIKSGAFNKTANLP
jgi:hypothetical protein